jgi:hypothetical protein
VIEKGGQLLKRFLPSVVATTALFLCLTQALAQVPTSTLTPGSVAPSGQPTPAQQNGNTLSGVQNPAMIGQIQLPAPSTQILFDREIVDIPSSGDCLQKVKQALDAHAVVPVSDPRCAAAMNRALELQRTHPESEPEY